MSIGKSSIARAVNATATKTQNTDTNNISINKFSLQTIGLLTVAKTTCDTTSLKSSIQNRGLLCPVLVAITDKDEVWLVDGYSRVSAAKELQFKQIDAIVIRVANKRDANSLYNEIHKSKPATAKEDIHEEKFRIVAIKDRDLPVHLL